MRFGLERVAYGQRPQAGLKGLYRPALPDFGARRSRKHARRFRLQFDPQQKVTAEGTLGLRDVLPASGAERVSHRACLCLDEHHGLGVRRQR